MSNPTPPKPGTAPTPYLGTGLAQQAASTINGRKRQLEDMLKKQGG